jgi:hypothetical protein
MEDFDMFKKIAALIAFALTVQGVAYAEAWPANVNYKQSNKVGIDYYSDDQNFTINTKHEAGNRVYSTSNNTSNIFFKENDAWKGDTLAETSASDTTVTGQSTYGAGWTSQ